MHRPRSLHTIILPILMAAALLFTACDEEEMATLQHMPSATPSPLFGAPLPGAEVIGTMGAATMIPTVVEPTITPPPVTLPPALVLPDASGVSVACESNTMRIPLKFTNGSALGAAIRLMASGDWLYLLADGGLYRIDRLKAETGVVTMEPLILRGNNTSGRPVQELVDLAIDPTNAQLILLDKAGHIYRYDPPAGTLGLAYRAEPGNDELDGAGAFQFTAITVDSRGHILLLDVARARVWRVDGQETLSSLNESVTLPATIDLAEANGSLFMLQRGGTLRASDEEAKTNMWRDSDPRPLGMRIRTSTHLGIPLIVAVDGLRREVTTYVPGGSLVARHAFAFPDLGLLRDAQFASQHLYALGGNDLLIYPGPADLASGTCPEYDPSMFDDPTLYGVSLLGALQDIRMPLENGVLPDRSHLYPGAMRLYRLGVHRGMDMYGYDKGTPVFAAASGTIAEAEIDYPAMTYAEFLSLTGEAEFIGQTPAENLDRLDGRRIVIDHGNGVRTLYAHLDSIEPGIFPGVHVDAGAQIGTVGVSGTSAESRPGTESPHLHFEIWLGNRYVGQDINLRETMWWLSEVFGG